MNINAINHMMINKNLKFRANEVPQEPQKPMGNSPEGTVTKPQEGMKALANNNIAFQGLNLGKTLPAVKSAGKKVLLGTLGAAMLAPVLTSCQKEPIYIERPPVIVDNDVTVNVDMSQINALLEYFKERDAKLFDLLNGLVKDLEQGRIDDAAFQEQVINFMLESKENQESIINLMIQNGKSSDEAKAYLEQILEEVKNGNMTAAEAYKQIMAELGEINESLDFIIEMLAQQAEQARDNAELEEARFNELIGMLAKLVEQGNDIGEILKNMDAKLARANDSLYKLGLNQEKIEAAIREIMAEHGEGITVGDLKAILGEQSAAWMAFFEAQMALQNDIINDNSAKVQDVLEEMNDKMVTKQVFNDQMNRLYELLKKAQEQGLAESQKIQDLIAGLDFSCDCNCDCGDQIDNNEGILGDLDNIVNGNN